MSKIFRTQSDGAHSARLSCFQSEWGREVALWAWSRSFRASESVLPLLPVCRQIVQNRNNLRLGLARPRK